MHTTYKSLLPFKVYEADQRQSNEENGYRDVLTLDSVGGRNTFRVQWHRRRFGNCTNK